MSKKAQGSGDNLDDSSDEKDAVPPCSGRGYSVPGGSGRGAARDARERKRKFPDEYAMDKKKRGIAIIINNKKFVHMSDRKGSDVDQDALYQRFNELGFDVRVYTDLTFESMENLMTEVAGEDHTNHDCFCCAVLSHGDGGNVYGVDSRPDIDSDNGIETLIENFRGDKCTTLFGKPKIFFIQACRGSNVDAGVTGGRESAAEADDEEEEEVRIPIAADFLIVYSTVLGYVSYRDPEKGTWFVQAISEVFRNYGQEYDLLTLMTGVNNIVAYNFENWKTGEKQMPCISSMLTKAVYFRSKN